MIIKINKCFVENIVVSFKSSHLQMYHRIWYIYYINQKYVPMYHKYGTSLVQKVTHHNESEKI